MEHENDFDNIAYDKELYDLWIIPPPEPDNTPIRIYINTLVRESWAKYKMSILNEEIDIALDNKNKELFNKLSIIKNDLLKYIEGDM